MAWDVLLDLAKVLGLPLALSLVAVWALVTGRVVPKTTHDAMILARDDQIRELRERNERTEESEKKYLDALLAGTRGLEQATSIINKDRQRRS